MSESTHSPSVQDGTLQAGAARRFLALLAGLGLGCGMLLAYYFLEKILPVPQISGGTGWILVGAFGFGYMLGFGVGWQRLNQD